MSNKRKGECSKKTTSFILVIFIFEKIELYFMRYGGGQISTTFAPEDRRPLTREFSRISLGGTPRIVRGIAGKYNIMKSKKTVWNAVLCSLYGFAILL